MKTVTARNLRERLSEHLDSVERGERVVVTRHGIPVAELVQIHRDAPPQQLVDALASGAVTRVGDMDALQKLVAAIPQDGEPVNLVDRLLADRR